MTQDDGRTRLGATLGRAAKFAAGFLVGVLSIPLVVLGGFTVLGLALFGVQQLSPPMAQVSVPAAFWTAGVDVSHASGASVTVERDEEITRQTCRGRCDDLVYWSGVVDRVEVRDASGRRLLQKEQDRRFGLFREHKLLGLGGDPLTLSEEAEQ